MTCCRLHFTPASTRMAVWAAGTAKTSPAVAAANAAASARHLITASASCNSAAKSACGAAQTYHMHVTNFEEPSPIEPCTYLITPCWIGLA